MSNTSPGRRRRWYVYIYTTVKCWYCRAFLHAISPRHSNHPPFHSVVQGWGVCKTAFSYRVHWFQCFCHVRCGFFNFIGYIILLHLSNSFHWNVTLSLRLHKVHISDLFCTTWKPQLYESGFLNASSADFEIVSMYILFSWKPR